MCAGLAHDLLRACGSVSHHGLSASSTVALGVEVWSKVVGGMLGGLLEEVAVALVSALPPPALPPPARFPFFCFALLNRNSYRGHELVWCALPCSWFGVRCVALHCIGLYHHCLDALMQCIIMQCIIMQCIIMQCIITIALYHHCPDAMP